MVYMLLTSAVPIPVDKLSQARAYGRSLAGVAGSNPAASMDVSVLCVLSGRGL